MVHAAPLAGPALAGRRVKESFMRLSLPAALALALIANLLPGCDRTATDAEEGSAVRGGTSGQTPAGAATGQASEGSTNDRKAPARPSSK
jgi:hypothetical protein